MLTKSHTGSAMAHMTHLFIFFTIRATLNKTKSKGVNVRLFLYVLLLLVKCVGVVWNGKQGSSSSKYRRAAAAAGAQQSQIDKSCAEIILG